MAWAIYFARACKIFGVPGGGCPPGKCQPDTLTPIEAMGLLYERKQKLN